MYAQTNDEALNLQDAIRKVRGALTDEEAAYYGRALATAAERFLEATLLIEPLRA